MARKPSVAACGYDSPDEEHHPLPTSPHPPGRRHVECVVDDVARPSIITTTLSGPSSLNDMITRSKEMRFGQKVGLRDRIACYQWTFFTMTMATGGVANVIFSVPYQAPWLNVAGTVFFLLNLVLFVTNCVLLTMRFRFRPRSFLESFTDQVESLFISSFFVSIGMILLTSCEYGTPHCGAWFLETMEVMFWLYLGVCMVASAGLYLILWSTQVFPLHTMTPIWVFPAYPLLLSAPLAGSLINAAITTKQIESLNAAAIATAAVAVQGTGFLISFMICSAFLYRLMTQKLPRDTQRPGVFIAIGPSGFTVAGFVNLGNQASLFLPADFMGGNQSVLILKILALMIGLSLWGLSMWFFLVAVGSLWKYCKPTKNMPFQMTFFSFVFPNTALVTATEQLGKVFDSNALKTVGSVFAACVVAVWAIVFYFMIRALWTRRLLWPKVDGDAD